LTPNAESGCRQFSSAIARQAHKPHLNTPKTTVWFVLAVRVNGITKWGLQSN